MFFGESNGLKSVINDPKKANVKAVCKVCFY